MKPSKKILFDGRFLSLSHAGLGRYTLELFKGLLKNNPKQKYILLVLRGVKFDRELAKAVNEHKEPVEIVETEIGHYSVSEQIKLPRLLSKLKPSLVHFPHFNHPLLYRGPFVVTIHDLTLSQYTERGNFLKKIAYNLIIAHAAKKARKILTVSDFVKKEIAREYKINLQKIQTTYNGIDTKFEKITNPKYVDKLLEVFGLVMLPVNWAQIEPERGHYDFSTIDQHRAALRKPKYL